jgi:hypothetical protein
MVCFNLQKSTLTLALLAALVVLPTPATAAASKATLSAVLDAPLRSQDPAAPIEVIAANWWVVTDKTSAEMTASIDPKRQMRSGTTVDVGTFTVDAAKGPVSLVVDYGAALKSMTGGTGGVRIGIECSDKPLACAIPINKTVLVFHGDLMAKLPIEVRGDIVPLVVGRDAHAYNLPAGETVRVQIELGQATDLEPVLVKAWLIYGKNAVDVVPGQTSKSTAIWLWVAGGALVLVALLWRLNRR